MFHVSSVWPWDLWLSGQRKQTSHTSANGGVRLFILCVCECECVRRLTARDVVCLCAYFPTQIGQNWYHYQSLCVQVRGDRCSRFVCDCFHRSQDEVLHSRGRAHTDTFDPELWNLEETLKGGTDLRQNKCLNVTSKHLYSQPIDLDKEGEKRLTFKQSCQHLRLVEFPINNKFINLSFFTQTRLLCDPLLQKHNHILHYSSRNQIPAVVYCTWLSQYSELQNALDPTTPSPPPPLKLLPDPTCVPSADWMALHNCT